MSDALAAGGATNHGFDFAAKRLIGRNQPSWRAPNHTENAGTSAGVSALPGATSFIEAAGFAGRLPVRHRGERTGIDDPLSLGAREFALYDFGRQFIDNLPRPQKSRWLSRVNICCVGLTNRLAQLDQFAAKNK